MEPDAVATDEKPRLSVRHRIGAWAEIVTILAVASFFAFSFLSHRVDHFVVEQYRWLSALAAVALFAMGVARLKAHFEGCASGELEEHSAWHVPVSACVVVLITPVIFALKVNPKDYSAEGFKKRLVKIPARDVELQQAFDWTLGLKKAGQGQTSQSISLPEKPSILDVLNAAGEGHQKALDGKVVTVLGQCDLPQGPKSERFDLYRLVVTCCVADATAVSIEIARRPTVNLEPGRWVRVQGVIRFDSKRDPSQPVIHAKMTSKIQKPSEPYL